MNTQIDAHVCPSYVHVTRTPTPYIHTYRGTLSHTGGHRPILGRTLPHWGTPSHTGEHPPTLGHIFAHWGTASHIEAHPPTLGYTLPHSLKGGHIQHKIPQKMEQNSKTNLVQYICVIICNQIWLHIIVICKQNLHKMLS